jgi:phage gp45-like
MHILGHQIPEPQKARFQAHLHEGDVGIYALKGRFLDVKTDKDRRARRVNLTIARKEKLK